jgi:predicted RNase H-like nuclease (RuvC/YqgF family)
MAASLRPLNVKGHPMSTVQQITTSSTPKPTPTRADEVRGEITTINHSISGMEAEISDLQGEIEILEDEREDLELELEELEPGSVSGVCAEDDDDDND